MGKLCSDTERASDAAEILKAIAHPLRLRIVAILCEKEEHVNGLAEKLGVAQSIVSQQLRILRMKNLVDATRENGFSMYRLNEPHLKRIVSCMDGCLAEREDRGGNRG